MPAPEPEEITPSSSEIFDAEEEQQMVLGDANQQAVPLYLYGPILVYLPTVITGAEDQMPFHHPYLYYPAFQFADAVDPTCGENNKDRVRAPPPYATLCSSFEQLLL